MTRRLAVALLSSSALVPGAALAQTAPAVAVAPPTPVVTVLPTGGTVVAGGASIGAPSDGAMRITQKTDRAIINWQSFSIGAGGRVDIVQPDARSALLNRVTGTATSEIAGQLNANGRVFLVNPNGILITKTGSVNAAGFTASTLDIADADFMAGSDELTVVGRRAATPIGRVAGGYAGLLAGELPDSGLIRARVATDVASGRAALDLSGDGFMQVALPAGGITVAGTINAHEVVLRAGTAREAARGTVNLTGTIRATGVENLGGVVTLTAADVTLTGATIDASGADGGGQVRVGGEWQGGAGLATATNLTVDPATKIRADATGSGDGGRVVLWSDAATSFAGMISATGAGGGRGGEAEVSGKSWLDYRGAADLRGPGGFGNLLLDPYNVTISNAASTGGFTATADDSIINATSLQNALATANVTVSTGTGGTQQGNITVAAPVTWSAASRLTLQAAGSIIVDAPITVVGGGQVTLSYDPASNPATGGLVFGRGASLTFASDAAQAGQALTINGEGYTLVRSMAELAAVPRGVTTRYALATDLIAPATAYEGSVIAALSGTLDGLGHNISGLRITPAFTFETGFIGELGVEGAVRNLGLVNASIVGRQGVGALVGINRGAVSNAYASGTVTADSNVGGLVGDNRGTVRHSSAMVAVSGSTYVGGLIGASFAGVVENAHASGAVNGSAFVGGLVGGTFRATIRNVYATGAVSGRSAFGGLIGLNSNSIVSGYWNTTTSGQTGSDGGTGLTTAQLAAALPAGFDPAVWGNAGNRTTPYLLGNLGPVILGTDTNSTPTYFQPILTMAGLEAMNANVAGNYLLARSLDAGGRTYGSAVVARGGASFSGIFDGLGHTISNLTIAGATGDVGLFGRSSGTLRNIGLLGGSVAGSGDFAGTGALVGTNNGAVIQSYATTTVTGGGAAFDYVGGLVGLNGASPGSSATIVLSYATGTVSGGRDSGGLVGDNNGTITQSYATGSASSDRGEGVAGGLVGGNNGVIRQSYAFGPASGGGFANGGLVGVNRNLIDQSYSTGVATGASAGGLLGFASGIGNDRSTVVNSYWNTETSGRVNGVGGGNAQGGSGTGRTTAQFQAGALPAGFDAGVWATGNGLYPYLRSFYPNGVQAISGFAYVDAGATVLASTGAGASARYVTGVIGGGATTSPVSTGANGYYYIPFAAGSLAASGTTVAPYSSTTPTGAPTGAALARVTGTTSGVNVYDGLFGFATTAATYSAVGGARAATAAGLTSAQQAIFAGLAPGYVATGAGGFTLDTALNLSSGFGAVTTAGPLTVAAPLTAIGGPVVLGSVTSLLVNAPVTINGTVDVRLGYNAATPLTGGLSFGRGAAITFNNGDGSPASSSAGATLSVNGNAYTLLYSMAQVDAIDTTGLAGRYALAGNLDAGGTTYNAAVVAPGNAVFSGVFEGLGHTISNLTIAGATGNVGLFGTSSGTLRDVGIVDGSVSGSGDFAGTGALVGTNNGAIVQAFASTTVTGGGAAFDYIGGLVGLNGASPGSAAIIALSYATGSVSGGRDSGGLVGDNNGTITQSYATGSASSDRGEGVAGGLTGGNNGVIRQSYATGPASGGGFANGGLVGVNRNLIDQSYATGAVANGGGLSGFASGVGNNTNTITNSYWDTQTTGQASSAGGGTGLTTAQFQAGGLPTGFDPTVWATGNGLYPYLRSFYPNGVEAISGVATAGGGNTPIAAGRVGVYRDGSLVGNGEVSTGANGYFYTIVPAGILATGGTVLGLTVTLPGTNVVSGLRYSDALSTDANGNLSGLFARAGERNVVTAASSVSALDTALATTFGASRYSALATTLANTSLVLDSSSTAGFLVNRALSASTSANIALSTVGDLTLAADLTASTVTLQSGGGIAQTAGAINAATLTGSAARSASLTGANAVGTLTSFTAAADLAFTNAQALTADEIVADTGSLTLTTIASPLTLTRLIGARDTVTLISGGAITQALGSVVARNLTGSAGGAVVLASGINEVVAINGFTTANGGFELFNRLPTLTVSGALNTGSGDIRLRNSGAIALAAGLSSSEQVFLVAMNGSIIQSAGIITAGRLAGFALTDVLLPNANAIASLNPITASTGTINIVAAGALAVTDDVASIGGGDVTIRAATNLTLASGIRVAGGTVTLSAGGSFINQAGANALLANTRWLVYAADPRTSTPGGLAPNFIQYAAPFGTTPAQDGNGFLYGLAPVVSVGLTGSAAKTYDGNASATLAAGNYVVDGAVAGDVVTVTRPTSGSYDNANAGTGKTVSVGGIAITSASNGGVPVYGYGLASTSASGAIGTISPATLTYTANRTSRTYGSANPAFSGSVSGFVNAETQASATTGTLVFTSPATPGSNVGSYAINGSGLSAGNYVFAQAAGNATALTINPYLLTVGGTRPYDGTTTFATRDLQVAAGVNGETVTLTGGSGATAGVNVGSYANSPLSGLTIAVAGGNASAGNYALPSTGTLVIGRRAVTVAADALSRIYGEANPSLTYTVGGAGLIAGERLAGGLATNADARSGVGGYAIAQGSVTDANNANYAISYVGSILTVTPRGLVVAADPKSRIYGEANPALTYTTGGMGLVNGDALSGALATTADVRSNVGAYAINQGSLTAGGNYALTYRGADLTVTPRALTVSADALSRVYGDANPALTYTTGGMGLVNGDALSGALATAADQRSNVGAYAITQGSLTAGGNYALTYRGADLTVSPRALTVSADALSRVYGDANPALTYTTGGMGLVNGDPLSGALATAADQRSNVGSYAITQGSLAASANYALTYRGAELTVVQRALTVNANPKTRVYGDANPALTYGVGGMGLANGDALSGALATAADQRSNVGSYAITQGNLAASANYALTYAGADLTVTQRALIVSADGQTRTYGDANPALTYQVGGMGLVNGDALTGALATAADQRSGVGAYAITRGSLAASANYAVSYRGADLLVTPRALTVTPDAVSRIYGEATPARGAARGDNLVSGDTVESVALASLATAASGVGSYRLGGSDALGSGLGNYAITYATRDGGLTITPRALTITADALSRVYGDANPALTYRVSGLGLVNGDTLTGTLATAAGVTSGVGGYGIARGSLAASANYQVSYVGSTLTVIPRPLTITANDLTRLPGEPNPALTFTVGGRGLVNGDVLTGSLLTPATATSLPGLYAILQGSLAASANYQVSYVPGTLRVGASQAVPLGLRAGTQLRDTFTADTMPPMDAAVLTIETRSGVSGLAEPTASQPDVVCPKEKVCPPTTRR